MSNPTKMITIQFINFQLMSKLMSKLTLSSIHEHTNSSYQPPFPNSGCSVNISEYTITRCLPYFLRKLPYDSKIRSHLFHRNSWSPDVTIDWSHFESFSRLI